MNRLYSNVRAYLSRSCRWIILRLWKLPFMLWLRSYFQRENYAKESRSTPSAQAVWILAPVYIYRQLLLISLLKSNTSLSFTNRVLLFYIDKYMDHFTLSWWELFSWPKLVMRHIAHLKSADFVKYPISRSAVDFNFMKRDNWYYTAAGLFIKHFNWFHQQKSITP